MVTAAAILNANILVVDDQEANVTLLECLLREAGYTAVSTTRDPRAVSELQRDNQYSLILLDLHMPFMDGFQVLNALKEVQKDDYVPVLVITALPAHKLRALTDGAKDFISKPFDVPELMLRIRNMLEVRLLHEASRDHGKAQQSLALTDPLTGLANRRLLVDRLSMALIHARRDRAAWRCSISISTASRRSTTRWATPPATHCSRWWRSGSRRRCARKTRWPGSAATSSSSCCG